MYKIAKCRNCGNIQPMNQIGHNCNICGESFVEEQSLIDYNSLIDNDTIFNEDLSLFYHNYVPFDNDILTTNKDDYNQLNIMILFKPIYKDNNSKEISDFIFEGVILNIHNKFYRIFINQFPSGQNEKDNKQVEIKEVYLKNLDNNLYIQIFAIKIPNNINDLPKLNNRFYTIYEIEYLNHMKIKEPSKVLEYISFNRIIDILRIYGIQFIEGNNYLCNFETFKSHPNLVDITKQDAIKDDEYYLNNYDDEKIQLRKSCYYVFSSNSNKNNLDVYSAKNYEDRFIREFMATNNLYDYESLFDFLDYKLITYCKSLFSISDAFSASLEHDLNYNTSQYLIYKICRSLGYNCYLDINFQEDDKKCPLGKIMINNVIQLDDNLIYMNSVKDSKCYGINILPNKDAYNKIKEIAIEEFNIFDKKNEIKHFDYNGNYIIDTKSISCVDFLLYCAKDLQDHREILKEETSLSDKRKEICEKIYTTMSLLDKTGLNTEKYQRLFEGMSDDEFNKYMKTFLSDDSKNFYLEVLPNKNEPSLKQIKSCLEYLNVPLDEYVYMRHDGHKNNPLRTRYKVPVGYIHLRRLQQMLQKKNTYSTDISKRSLKTNQVTGDDKIARISDAENYALSALGCEKALQEFLGPRADGSDSKMEMYKEIANEGYTKLDTLPNDISKKQTINTLNAFIMGAGLTSDLISEDFISVKSNSKNVNNLL